MRTSVPHDVDLEDRLVFGLTPIRFGYLVIGVLGAMSLWGQRWLPVPVRVPPCLVIAALAVALAWGRWKGRPLDRLALDVVIFCRRNYRLQLIRPQPRPAGAPALPAEAPAPPSAALRLAAINDVGRRRLRPSSNEEAA